MVLPAEPAATVSARGASLPADTTPDIPSPTRKPSAFQPSAEPLHVDIFDTRGVRPTVPTSGEVEVIDAVAISRNAAVDLPSLLGGLAGISIRDGSSVGNATIDLAGFGVGASSNTLILLDGMPLNDNDESVPRLSTIPLTSLERIEILRGSGSVAWGSGASAGVINLVTHQRTGGGAQWSGGNFGRRTLQFSWRDRLAASAPTPSAAGAPSERLLLEGSLQAHSAHTDGYRENAASDTQSIVVGLHGRDTAAHALLRRFDLAADGRWQEQGLPGARTVDPVNGIDQFQDDPQGSSTPKDHGSERSNTLRLAAESGDFRSDAWGGLRANGQIDAFWREKRVAGYYVGYASRRDMQRGQLAPRLKFFFGEGAHGGDMRDTRETRSVLLLGGELNEQRAQLFSGSSAPDKEDGRLSLRSRALWSEWVQPLSAHTQLQLGARSESATQQLDQLAALHKTYPLMAWNAALWHRWAEGSTLGARLGSSYRIPNADELLNPGSSGLSPQIAQEASIFLSGTLRAATTPGTSLDASASGREVTATQETHSVAASEAGTFPTDGDQSQYGWRITLRQLRLRDEIAFHPYVGGGGFGRTINLDPTERIQGLVSWHATHPLAWGIFDYALDLTWQRARFRSGEAEGIALAGKRIPLVPERHAQLRLGWAVDQHLRGDATLDSVGPSVLDNDFANTGTLLPAYTTLGVKIGYQLAHWRFSAALENLTDTRYATYGVQSTISATYNLYPAAPRSIWLSAGLAF